MKTHKKKLLILGLVGVGVIAAVLVLAAGGDTRFGLTESERKDLIEVYLADGREAEAAAIARHPNDEDEQMKVFRADLEAMHTRLLATYGVTHDEADEIFREARTKGWW